MKNKIAREAGFTLVEIMIVVAIIGLLAAMAIPNLANARYKAQTNCCINNLHYIDGAKQPWALEQRKLNTDTPSGADLQPYLGSSAGGTLPVCPADSVQTFTTSYNPQSVGARPLCLINPTAHLLP